MGARFSCGIHILLYGVWSIEVLLLRGLVWSSLDTIIQRITTYMVSACPAPWTDRCYIIDLIPGRFGSQGSITGLKDISTELRIEDERQITVCCIDHPSHFNRGDNRAPGGGDKVLSILPPLTGMNRSFSPDRLG